MKVANVRKGKENEALGCDTLGLLVVIVIILNALS